MSQKLYVDLQFRANTDNAKKQIQSLQQTLNQAISSSIQGKPLDITPQLDQARMSAMQLKSALEAATNVDTGRLNLNKFAQQMTRSGVSMKQLAKDLQMLGPEGTKAFGQMTTALQSAETKMFSISTSMHRLMSTFMNTMRYQISAAAIQSVTQAISGAISYTKELDKSLTDIRIVTGKSATEMENFAVQANKAAKSLSVATNEYVKASHIYFQQGLDTAEAMKRAETTIKLAHATGASMEEVSDWMTAIWNNFDDGTKTLEYYGDVLAKLGAATASSADEIAQGLNKFAAVAETVGLSYEYAASALATITAETRQSADVVGTALKTLFARMEGLKLGETLDDGTTLNQYSLALESVGVSIKDANGELKNMDIILDEAAIKWTTLSKDQQVALAQSVAGIRQYTQFIALMDNYDVMQANIKMSKASAGELEKMQEIYAQSIEGWKERLGTSKEALISSLIDDDALKDFYKAMTKILDFSSRITKAFGGLEGILLMAATALTRMYQPQLANMFTNMAVSSKDMVTNLQNSVTSIRNQFRGENNQIPLKATRGEQMRQEAMSINRDLQTSQIGGIASQQINESIYETRRKLAENEKTLTASQKDQLNWQIQILEATRDTLAEEEKRIEAMRQANAAQQQAITEQADPDDIARRRENIKNLQAGGEGAMSQLTGQFQVGQQAGIGQNIISELQKAKAAAQELGINISDMGFEDAIGDAQVFADSSSEDVDALKAKYEQLKQTVTGVYSKISTAAGYQTTQVDTDSVKISTKNLENRSEKLGVMEARGETMASMIQQTSQASMNNPQEKSKLVNNLSTMLKESKADAEKLGLSVRDLGFEDAEQDIEEFATKSDAKLSDLLAKIEEFQNKLHAGSTEDINTPVENTALEAAVVVEGAAENLSGLEAGDAASLDKLQESKEFVDAAGSEAIEATKKSIQELTTAKQNQATEEEKLAQITDKNSEAYAKQKKAVDEARKSTADAEKGHKNNIKTLKNNIKANTNFYSIIGKNGKALKDLGKSTKNAAKDEEKLRIKTAQVTKTAEQQRQKIMGMADGFEKFGKTMASGLSTTMSMVSGLNMLTNGVQSLTTALNDGKLSFDEFLNIAMSMAPALMYLVPPMLKLVSTMLKGIGAQKEKNAATLEGNVLQEKQNEGNIEGALTEKLDTEATEENVEQKQEEIATDAGLTVAEEVLDETEKDGSNEALANAKKEEVADKRKITSKIGVIGAKISEWLAGGPPGWATAAASIAAIVAIMGGIGLAVASGVKKGKEESTQEEMEADREVVSQANEVSKGLSGLTEQVDTFKNLRESGESTVSVLEDMAETVKSINTEIDELLLKGNRGDWGFAKGLKSSLAAAVADLEAGVGDIDQLERIINNAQKQISAQSAKTSYSTYRTSQQTNKDDPEKVKEDLNTFLSTTGTALENNQGLMSEAVETFVKNKASYKTGPEAERAWGEAAIKAVMGEDFSLSDLGDEDQAILSLLSYAPKQVHRIINGLNLLQTNGSLYNKYGQDKVNKINNWAAPDDPRFSYLGSIDFSSDNEEDWEKGYLEAVEKENYAQKKQKAEKYKVSEDAFEHYTESIMENNSELAENEDLAAELGLQTIRLSQGVEQLGKKYNELNDIFERGQKAGYQYSNALGEMAKILTEMFGFEITSEQTEQYMDYIKQIMEGGEQGAAALGKLRQATSQDFIENFTYSGIDDDGKGASVADQYGVFSELRKQFLTDSNSEISAANKAILNEMLKAGQITKEDLENFFGGLSLAIELPDQATGYDGNLVAQIGDNTKVVEGLSDKDIIESINPNLDKEIDRYYEIKELLSDVERQLNKIDKAKSRAFGKSKLTLMKQEIDQQKLLIQTEEEYLRQMQEGLKEDYLDLDGRFEVDAETGRILNYVEVLEQLKEEGSFNYDKIKESADKYTESLNGLEEQQEKVNDAVYALADKELEKINAEVDLSLHLSDNDIAYIDFLMKEMDDPLYDAAEAIGLMGEKLAANGEKIEATFTGLKGVISKINPEFEKTFENLDLMNMSSEELLTTLTSTMGDTPIDAAYITQIEEYMQSLYGLGGDIKTFYADVMSHVNNAFEGMTENGEKATSRVEQLGSTLETYANIVDLIGAKTLKLSTDQLQALSAAQIEQAKTDLKVKTQRLQTQQAYLDAAEAQYQAMLESGDTVAAAYWKEQADTYRDSVNEMQGEVESALGDTLQLIAEEFTASIERATNAFKEAIGGMAGSVDHLQEMFNQQKELSELYVQDYEKIYELSKLNRDINKSIDNSDSVKGKQILRDLQEEINEYEKDGKKMSEHDLQYLRKKYELKMAEIALEEAQNAKSTVRMRRDSEGNWSYVYTADEDKTDKAQQNFEDKLYEIQQPEQEYIDEMQDRIIQSQIDMAEAINNIRREDYATQEEYETEVARVTEHYTALQMGLREELLKALDNSKKIYESDWTQYSKSTGYKISSEELWKKSFADTEISILTGFETMEQYNQAFVISTSAMVDSVKGEYERWEGNTDDVLWTVGTSIDDFGKTNGTLDTGVKQITDKLNTVVQEFDKYSGAATSGFQSIVDQASQKLKAFAPLIESWNGKIGTVTSGLRDWIKLAAQVEGSPVPEDSLGGQTVSGTGKYGAAFAMVNTEDGSVKYFSAGSNFNTKEEAAAAANAASKDFAVEYNSIGERDTKWQLADTYAYDNTKANEYVVDDTHSYKNAITGQSATATPGPTNLKTATKASDYKATGGGGTILTLTDNKVGGEQKINAERTLISAVGKTDKGFRVVHTSDDLGTRTINLSAQDANKLITKSKSKEDYSVYEDANKEPYILSKKIDVSGFEDNSSTYKLTFNNGDIGWFSPETAGKILYDFGLEDQVSQSGDPLASDRYDLYTDQWHQLEPGDRIQHRAGGIERVFIYVNGSFVNPDGDNYRHYSGSTISTTAPFVTLSDSDDFVKDHGTAYKIWVPIAGETATDYGKGPYQIYTPMYSLQSYDTGGYTGSWDSSGRLAMLHQKEIVLNAQDTENFLAAVNIVRDIAKAIDLQAVAYQYQLNKMAYSGAIAAATQTLQQDVTIHAEFPNVRERSEIEAAFDNLLNRASQFANRKN